MRKILLYTGLLALIIGSVSCNRELRRIEKSNDLEKKLAYADKMYEKKNTRWRRLYTRR